MVYQNGFYISKLKTKKFLGLVSLVSFILIILLLEGVIREFGGQVLIPYSVRIPVILIGIGVYVYIVHKQYKQNLTFLYYTDEDKDHLVFRFYQVVLFGKKYTTYKIPITSFHSFKIIEEKPYKELVLFQRIKNKIAKYPPISLSGVESSGIETIKESLSTYSKK